MDSKDDDVVEDDSEPDGYHSDSVLEPEIIMQEESFDIEAGHQVFIKQEPCEDALNVNEESFPVQDKLSHKEFILPHRILRQNEQNCDSNDNLPENILESIPCSSNYKTSGPGNAKRDINSKVQEIQCPFCTYKTTQKTNFRRHSLTHSSVKKFKCSECDYETNRRDKLRAHILNHSDIRLFKCSDCSYETNNPTLFKNHLLNHSDIRIYNCSECSYKSNDKRNFRMHLLVHSNEAKLYKCAECDYESNFKCNFKLHLLSHLDTKLFKCSECIYESNNKGNYERHVLNHSDTKLYKCECNFGTNLKGSLKRHQARNCKLRKKFKEDIECD